MLWIKQPFFIWVGRKCVYLFNKLLFLLIYVIGWHRHFYFSSTVLLFSAETLVEGEELGRLPPLFDRSLWICRLKGKHCINVGAKVFLFCYLHKSPDIVWGKEALFLPCRPTPIYILPSLVFNFWLELKVAIIVKDYLNPKVSLNTLATC